MRGPPEFPGFIAASVCMYLTRLFAEPDEQRLIAEIMPRVKELAKLSPKGLPKAKAEAPTLTSSEFPNVAGFKPVLSTFITAISVLLS